MWTTVERLDRVDPKYHTATQWSKWKSFLLPKSILTIGNLCQMAHNWHPQSIFVDNVRLLLWNILRMLFGNRMNSWNILQHVCLVRMTWFYIIIWLSHFHHHKCTKRYLPIEEFHCWPKFGHLRNFFFTWTATNRKQTDNKANANHAADFWNHFVCFFVFFISLN